jgi:serine/threonine protein phosphatase 1
MKKINPNVKEDKLVMLGDFIDRGEQSWELVNEVKTMQEKYGSDHVVLLRGNHEQMAIDYVLHNDINWLHNGAHSTLESFKRNNDSIENYIDFFMGLPLYHEDEKFIYVHGGIKPGVSMSKQKENDLLWIRDEFYSIPNTTGKIVVFGHTPTISRWSKSQPVWLDNNLALDTGCVFGGALSALEIENGKVLRIHQTESRRAS